MMDVTIEDIMQRAQQQHVEFISLQFTDIAGMLKNVTIPASMLADCLDHGVWFDGSALEGPTRVAETDMYLIPDRATFAVIPWDDASGVTTARLICDVYSPDGRPYAGDPRRVLRRAVADAQAMGFTYNLSAEVEFFLFKADADGRPVLVPNDSVGYFDATNDSLTRFRRHVVKALGAYNIEVNATHHEGAVGQHEIDLRLESGLAAADAVATMRQVLRSMALSQGLFASFMPKPMMGSAGSGMHVHQSLADAHSGVNLFYDSNDSYGLSVLARHFMAGLLAHAPGMLAILAPLVNSYKRLVPGFEAPIYVSWGRTNRGALIRVPRVLPERPQTTRIELRSPDPSCNPYLAYAVMLQAGLDGIRRELPLQPAAEEDLVTMHARSRSYPMLPMTLGDALIELQRDEVIAETLGPLVYQRFVELRQREWEEYRQQVSSWELERYLPIF
ncbi:MAG: glutamine synthetase family protein [Roseiflexaceae bacterium]|jgi:glutamine synthetase|nr:glutamine synthetase family protein [Chloroflexaceae bacterium]MCE2851808.1 glutamine synthetase family protein [Chloroflexaceae bacterium]